MTIFGSLAGQTQIVALVLVRALVECNRQFN